MLTDNVCSYCLVISGSAQPLVCIQFGKTSLSQGSHPFLSQQLRAHNLRIIIAYIFLQIRAVVLLSLIKCLNWDVICLTPCTKSSCYVLKGRWKCTNRMRNGPYLAHWYISGAIVVWYAKLAPPVYHPNASYENCWHVAVQHRETAGARSNLFPMVEVCSPIGCLHTCSCSCHFV